MTKIQLPLVNGTLFDTGPPRVLIMAEGVTLAHVVRPLSIARALQSRGYDVQFAVDRRHHAMLGDFAATAHALPGIEPSKFMASLARGAPVFELETLRQYVRDDLALFSKLSPDLVIGDFRLSLAVSARRASVPYVAISNAYWSAAFRPTRYPLPVLPFTSFMPIRAAEAVFRLAQPTAFKLHCKPMDRLRRENGMVGVEGDIHLAYTDSDDTLLADIPEMYGASGSAAERFIGAVPWAPSDTLPPWWNELDGNLPVVYVALGSSGSMKAAAIAVQALSSLPVLTIVSTAGRSLGCELPANTRAARYLPGSAVAKRASLVVCNGGSPATQQALAEGTPVLGICSNMDQFLNMFAVERAGAGLTMRADRVNLQVLRSTVTRLLDGRGRIHAAKILAILFGVYRFDDRLDARLRLLLPRN